MTSGSLWNYYRDEVNDDANENNAGNYRIDNSKTVTSKSFEYKTTIIGSTPAEKRLKKKRGYQFGLSMAFLKLSFLERESVCV